MRNPITQRRSSSRNLLHPVTYYFRLIPVISYARLTLLLNRRRRLEPPQPILVLIFAHCRQPW